MAEIKPFLSNSGALLNAIREIAKDSSRVFFALAFEKGVAGNVSMSQIWKCLECGDISYTPVAGEHGHTLCNLTYISAGQDVHIAIAVEEAGSANDRKIHVLHISEG